MKLPVIMLTIVCLGSAATAQPKSERGMTAEGARQWLENYVRIWSSDSAVNIATVAKYYAPVVNYYGKRMNRMQVLADKRRYINTYPGRTYNIVEGTVAVGCNSARTMCTTSGVMRIQLVDRAGIPSTRTARLQLLISAAGGGQIVRESASRLRHASR